MNWFILKMDFNDTVIYQLVRYNDCEWKANPGITSYTEKIKDTDNLIVFTTVAGQDHIVNAKMEKYEERENKIFRNKDTTGYRVEYIPFKDFIKEFDNLA